MVRDFVGDETPEGVFGVDDGDAPDYGVLVERLVFRPYTVVSLPALKVDFDAGRTCSGPDARSASDDEGLMCDGACVSGQIKLILLEAELPDAALDHLSNFLRLGSADVLTENLHVGLLLIRYEQM